MADTKKKYYKLSKRETKSSGTKFYITIDDEVKPTAQEMADVRTYIECGYILRHKSKERAEAARKRAKEKGFGKKKKAE